MKLVRRLILVIVVLLVVGAIVAATFPADSAYRYVADRLGAIRLAGIRGTVWSGHANSAQVFGQDLGALDWTLQASPLLLHGLLEGHVAVAGSAITAAGDVQRETDGSIALHAATFSFPASLAAPVLDIPALEFIGTIVGSIPQARLRGIVLSDAAGSLRWNGAAVAGAAQAQLGDLGATFNTTADGSIEGEVRDFGGPLELAGKFKISAGGFDADARLSARDGNPQVIEALRYVGEPQADGSSHLIIHGQLFKLF